MFRVSTSWKRVMAGCGAVALLLVVCGTIVVGRVVYAPYSPRPFSGWHGHGRELVLVHTISRHGERTPADTFPTDPHINDTFAPFGWGALTNAGRMHMYKIGQFMRNRYNNFLGDLYSEDATYAQSTGANRARMSCELILAGLWPPSNTPLEWNPLLNWQPIPVVAQELDDDTLLLVRKRCPRYNEALDEVLNGTIVLAELKNNAELLKELTEKSGIPIINYDDVQSIYSTLKAEESFGMELAEWTKNYYPEKLIPMTVESFIINSYTDELIRLKGGVFLKKLISDWQAVATDSKRPARISVYTGHDATVANLARALGVWEPQVPDYGITLLLELYRDATNQYSLEVYIQNSTRVEPFQLTIPGCSTSCPLNKVISLRKKVLPVDWEFECISHDPSYEPPPPSGP